MGRRAAGALLLITLLPVGLAGLAGAAPSPSQPVHSQTADQPAPSLLQLITLPQSVEAPTDHVGIVPSALRPIEPYRTAPPPAAPVDPTNPVALAGALAQLAPGPLGIPGIMMHAYQHAADLMATVQPSCQLPWNLLAGIGKVESGHANGGQADIYGNTTTRILGPVLDGHLAGNAVITDSDGGRLDGDTSHDRAVGPMQFMPGTWSTFGADGNDDGVIDPNNVYDAAFAAGRLLCSTGGSLADIRATGPAIMRYNHSAAYVQNVQAWAVGYGTGAYPTESELPAIGAGEKSIDAAPDLKPAPTPDNLPPPAATPPPPASQLEIAPGVVIPLPVVPCLINCPAPTTPPAEPAPPA